MLLISKKLVWTTGVALLLLPKSGVKIGSEVCRKPCLCLFKAYFDTPR